MPSALSRPHVRIRKCRRNTEKWASRYLTFICHREDQQKAEQQRHRQRRKHALSAADRIMHKNNDATTLWKSAKSATPPENCVCVCSSFCVTESTGNLAGCCSLNKPFFSRTNVCLIVWIIGLWPRPTGGIEERIKNWILFLLIFYWMHLKSVCILYMYASQTTPIQTSPIQIPIP